MPYLRLDEALQHAVALLPAVVEEVVQARPVEVLDARLAVRPLIVEARGQGDVVRHDIASNHIPAEEREGGREETRRKPEAVCQRLTERITHVLVCPMQRWRLTC